MRLLSVDTTTRWGSVALLRDADVLGEVRLYEEGGHSRSLFTAIECLLRATGLTPLDVDAYAVAIGPGSFTGVRVGLSAIKGLALGSPRPCLGLTSLLGLAARMRGSADTLVPMIDAFRDQVFSAFYDRELRPLQEPRSEAPEERLRELRGGVAFLGDGAIRYRDRILGVCPAAVFSSRSLFVAADLGRLAAAQFAAGGGVPAAALKPVYLRAPDIRPPQAPQAGP